MYSIGNEIPDTGRPSGAALGRAIAERIRALDDTRLVTNSINPMLSVRDGRDRVARQAGSRSRRAEDTGVNTMMSMMEQFLPAILQHEVVDERTAESYAYLDVAGYNYTESRYAMDRELHPHRVIVGSENRPPSIARELAAGARAPARDRRLHLDRLGLPRRGRHRSARSTPSEELGGFMGDYPWLTAHCGDIDITGSPTPGVVLARDRLGPARRARTSRCGRPRTTVRRRRARSGWSFTDAIASWSWPGFEGQPVTVEVYADADEVELLVNGTPVGSCTGRRRTTGTAPSSRPTYTPGDLTAVAYRDGAETGRTTLRIGDRPGACSTCGSTVH